jgi:carboxyl-terminal processing protease
MNLNGNLNKMVSGSFGRRGSFLAAAMVVIMLMAGVAQAQNDQISRQREFYSDLKMLTDVYDYIINNHVDEKDAHDIMVAGIKGMLEELDAHSNYLPPMNYEDLMMSTEGEFGGLGITINIREHFPTVVSPIEGTPAYYMGIRGGDQIIEIEGETTFDFSSRDAVKLLRGPAGTDVNITIGRPGVTDPIPFTITRDIIKIESVPYAFMIDDIGYIRIQNFARSTSSEVKVALDGLLDDGMKGLILDLRFNPGGLLRAAQEVSEIFLEREKLIVFTKGRLRSQNNSYYSETRGKVYNEFPTIVMVNGSSASASEILAAALQDHDAGLVVGKTSYGKGSVQTVYPLDEDEAIKLTTARYYAPSGRSIHKERNRDGEEPGHEGLAEGDSLQSSPADMELSRIDKKEFLTDSGRVVYGGGGVTPDIEIEQDFLADFEVAVERDGVLFSYAVDFASDHEFVDGQKISDEMFDGFKEYLQGREKIEEYLGVFELAYSDSLIDANSDYLKRGIRRELARRTTGPEAAYRVAIEADTQLHEALELFRQGDSLAELLEIAKEWNDKHMKELAEQKSTALDETATVDN